MLHVDLSSRIRSRPPCHSESASAVPIYAALHIVIPNPLQRCHIRGPAHCHSESASAVRNLLFPPVVSRKRGVPRVSPLFRPGIPALIETDSYQGTPSGLPPPTHPATPRPSGATATAHYSALPLIKTRQAHGEGAFKSYSRFRSLKFLRHAHARVSPRRGAAVGRAPPPANTIR